MTSRHRLVELRRARGLTQQQVADAIGISQAMYQRIETSREAGSRRLSDQHIWALADLYQVHPGELFAPLPALPKAAAEAADIALALEPEDLRNWLALGKRLTA